MRKLATLAAAAFALAGCSGSSIMYFRVMASEGTTQSVSNCSVYNGPIYTYSGIDGMGTWAIYPAPSGSGGATQYLLDDGSGNLLAGSPSSGGYTFTGSAAVDTKGTSNSPEVTITTKKTVQITMSGDGFTGSVTLEDICVSGGSYGCQGAQDTGGYDCISSTPVKGVELSGITHTTDVSANPPTAPTQDGNGGIGGNNGGGNGGNGGNNGGNNGGSGGGFAGSCTITGAGLCIDFVGSSYSPSSAQTQCASQGTYSSSPCTGSCGGTCYVNQGTPTEYDVTCSGNGTSSTVQTACTGIPGGVYN